MIKEMRTNNIIIRGSNKCYARSKTDSLTAMVPRLREKMLRMRYLHLVNAGIYWITEGQHQRESKELQVDHSSQAFQWLSRPN